MNNPPDRGLEATKMSLPYLLPSVTVSNVLIAASLVLLARLLLKSRGKGDVSDVPGPTGGHWFWGHELETFRHEATESYSAWLRLHGPTIKIKAAFFHHDLLVVTDNTAVQYILQNCYHYVKSPQFRPPIVNLIGEGVVWAEGDMHRQQRRILQPAFTAESVKGMAQGVIEASEKLRQRLIDHLLSAPEVTVNIVEWTSSATLDIIGKVGFGHDFQAGQSPEAKKIASTWNKHVNEGLGSVGFVAPLFLRTFPFITRLPIKAMNAQGEIKVIVGNLAREIVQNKRGVGSGNNDGKDILSILLRNNERDPNSLSKKHVIDNITTIVMVGHETTAGVLDFTLLSLARSPDVQSKLRAELLDAGSRPDFLSYEQIHRLTYLDAVTKEAMRLHPASPQTERVVLKDDVLPLRQPIKTESGKTLTSLSLRAGQVIHIPFMSMQTSPSVWGDDAMAFKPERWLSEKGLPPLAERPHGWSGLVTFCDGPRSCLGYRLAVYECKVILATLIRQFIFSSTEARVQQRIAPTLQPVVEGRGGYLPLKVSLVL